MRIYDLVPDIERIERMPKEELGYMLLQVANANLHNRGMVGRNTVISLDSPLGQPERVPFPLREHLQPVLNEALHWLETQGLLIPAEGENERNGYRVLSRDGLEAVDRRGFESYLRTSKFPKQLLHPAIADRVWDALARNEPDTAVFLAFRTVEEAVRAAGGFATTDLGVNLMRKAFHPDTGPLTAMNQPQAERQALMELFSGAIGSYKNPHSHRTVAVDLEEAQEQVIIASHLLRIVDARRPKPP